MKIIIEYELRQCRWWAIPPSSKLLPELNSIFIYYSQWQQFHFLNLLIGLIRASRNNMSGKFYLLAAAFTSLIHLLMNIVSSAILCTVFHQLSVDGWLIAIEISYLCGGFLILVIGECPRLTRLQSLLTLTCLFLFLLCKIKMAPILPLLLKILLISFLAAQPIDFS